MNIQKQIKENSLSTQAYFDDLNKWVSTFSVSDAPSATKVQDEDEDFVKVAAVPAARDKVLVADAHAPAQGRAAPNQPVRLVRSQARLSDVEMATRKKDQGNAAFKEGKFTEAMDGYTVGLSYLKSSVSTEKSETDKLGSVILANRALVFLKMADPVAAISDCTAALEADAGNVKALFRRAQANVKLAKYEEALTDLLRCRTDVGQEAETEILRVQTALQFHKEKQRSIARNIITDPTRPLTNKPLSPLAIGDLQENPTQHAQEPVVGCKPAYVPRSVRMASRAGPVTSAQIQTDGEFQKLWREKSRRLELVQQIDCSRIPAIFRESMDFEMFASLIEFAVSHATQLPPAKSVEILTTLTAVKRFSLLVGLLGRNEKDMMRTFLETSQIQESVREEICRAYALSSAEISV